MSVSSLRSKIRADDEYEWRSTTWVIIATTCIEKYTAHVVDYEKIWTRGVLVHM